MSFTPRPENHGFESDENCVKGLPAPRFRRLLALFLALSISLPAIAQTAPGGAALLAKAAALEAAGKYQAAGAAYHEAKDAFMTEQNYDGAGKALGKVSEMFQKELSAPAAPPRFAAPAAPPTFPGPGAPAAPPAFGGAALEASAAALNAAGKIHEAGDAYVSAGKAYTAEGNQGAAAKAYGNAAVLYEKEAVAILKELDGPNAAPPAPPRFAIPAAPAPPVFIPSTAPVVAPAAPAVAAAPAAPAALAGDAPTKELVEKLMKARWDRPKGANSDKVLATIHEVKFGQAYIATLKEVQVQGLPEGALVTPVRIDYTRREYNHLWTSVTRWPHIEAVVFKDKFSEWTLHQTGGSTDFKSTKEPAENR